MGATPVVRNDQRVSVVGFEDVLEEDDREEPLYLDDIDGSGKHGSSPTDTSSLEMTDGTGKHGSSPTFASTKTDTRDIFVGMLWSVNEVDLNRYLSWRRDGHIGGRRTFNFMI